jgi:prepilin-type N-terminal cleavage/methylation domain-containing protein
MKRKGMTLVELLIVIGIIAVLAGLLFPVFTSVRERARITYCINNLKQVGAALHMYAQDHDGFVPPYTNVIDSSYLLPNSNDPNLFEAAYSSYTKSKQIWYCPLDPYAGMNTLKLPEGPQPPTWRASYWNLKNHKATSYAISDIVADIAFAPLHINNVPNRAQIRLVWDQRQNRRSPINMIKDLEKQLEPYAVDFTHYPYLPPWETICDGIELYFDGSVKVINR